MNDHRSLKPDSEALTERLRVLKETLPECFTEGRLDPIKLSETLGEENLDEGPERYGLTWPGKRESRTRAFKPSNMALHFTPGEGVNEDTTKNLVIEGENLEVLRLLQKAYRGRVKMIYIDPPYNTGNDFVYDDKFAESPLEYEKRTGLRAEDGTALQSNRKSSGRFHSNWLSMMYPRLVLARETLTDDGAIFVSIDENEYGNLVEIVREIFGDENHIASFIWEKRTTRENRRAFSFNHEYLVCLTKNEEFFQESMNLLPMTDEVRERYSNPDNDPRGEWQSVSINAQGGHATKSQFYTITLPSGRKLDPPAGRCWIVTKDRLQELIKDDRIWFGEDGNNAPRRKVFLSEAREGLTPHTLWRAEEVGTNDSAKKALVDLFDGREVFDTPKPVGLVTRMIGLSARKESIILDFFAGSGTTAQAVLEINEEDGGTRQFILVQMPEETPEDSQARKAGYKNIADIAKERVRRVIKKINKEKGKITDRDRGFRVLKLARTGFEEWHDFAGGSLEEYEKQLSLHLAETDEKVKEEDLVAEIMLKEGFPLDSRIEKIEEGSLAVTRVESGASPHRLFVCLDAGFGRSLTVRTFEKLGVTPEDVFVCRDDALTDEAKLRIRELCRLATV